MVSVLDVAANSQDIHALYKIMLNRLPESKEVIAEKVTSGLSVGEHIAVIADSQEFRSIRTSAALGMSLDQLRQMLNAVSGSAMSDQQVGAFMLRIQESWTELGESEPWMSVMTDPRYASKDFDDTVEDEFYRSGISDAGYLMAFYDQFGKVPKFEANCLELGCGLGRIGFAIAPSFAQYTGVDISTSHLKIAASRQLKRSSHALTRQGKSLEFMELRKWIGDVEKKRYELFYSLLVLQHNPPPLSIYLLKLGLSQLAVGGVAVIQIPYFIEGYNFQENAYFQERRHLMEMHAIPQHMILDAAAEEACRTRLVMEDGRVGPMGRSATFVFEKYT